MEKLIPPDIFMLKTDEQADLMINIDEFYEILMKNLKLKQGHYSLTFPETIIKISNLGTCLLHMDDGKLVFCSDLTKHTIDKFYKRCAFFRPSNGPLCVSKPNFQKNNEKCLILFKVNDSIAQWKKYNSILIQRYLTSSRDVLFKARITYNTKKETFNGKLMWKEADKSYKISRDEEVKEEEIHVNEDLRVQMKDLYEILQEECDRAEVVEIVADFVQGDGGKWYFIELLHGKLECIENKWAALKTCESKMEGETEPAVEIVEDEKVITENLQEEAIKDLEILMKSSEKSKKHRKKNKKKL
jgi:hypothetical protein